MARGRIVAWLVVACATLVAQVVPRAFCRACDLVCCEPRPVETGESRSCCEQATSCCREAVTCCDTAADTPCRCQLEPRDDQPSSQPRLVSITLDHGAWTPAPAIATPDVPQVLGASREYLAAALAVPIRPPRILFGVWRN